MIIRKLVFIDKKVSSHYHYSPLSVRFGFMGILENILQFKSTLNLELAFFSHEFEHVHH